MENAENTISEYRSRQPIYHALSTRLQQLMSDIIRNNNIDFHIVETRAKTVSSFSEKIQRKGKKYTDPINEINDLCGCRVILYYIDDIEKVKSLLSREFSILEVETSHQPSELDADRFGYLSLHLIATIGENRENLDEWKTFKGLKFEVQIRTVIQHAWSAVSHAMQYKQEMSVPSQLRRRLHRIAGLFELADEEFLSIRTRKEELSIETQELIDEGKENIPLSITSIDKLVANWKGFKSAEKEAISSGFTSGEDDNDVSFVVDIHDLAVKSGIKYIHEISDIIDTEYNKSLFSNLSKIYNSPGTASPEFLAFAIFASKNVECLEINDMEKNGWSEDLAEEFIEAIRKSPPPT